jgi:hypothetical protein
MSQKRSNSKRRIGASADHANVVSIIAAKEIDSLLNGATPRIEDPDQYFVQAAREWGKGHTAAARGMLSHLRTVGYNPLKWVEGGMEDKSLTRTRQSMRKTYGNGIFADVWDVYKKIEA